MNSWTKIEESNFSEIYSDGQLTNSGPALKINHRGKTPGTQGLILDLLKGKVKYKVSWVKVYYKRRRYVSIPVSEMLTTYLKILHGSMFS